MPTQPALSLTIFAALAAGALAGPLYPACILTCELACCGTLIVPVALPVYLACAQTCPAGCLASCFDPESPIDTAAGARRAAEIAAGDQLADSSVVTSVTHHPGMFEFISAVTPGTMLNVTIDHQCLVTRGGRDILLPAAEIRPGDELDGRPVLAAKRFHRRGKVTIDTTSGMLVSGGVPVPTFCGDFRPSSDNFEIALAEWRAIHA